MGGSRTGRDRQNLRLSTPRRALRRQSWPATFRSDNYCFFWKLAERKGFEPSRRLPVYSLSRGAPSTTRPPLRSVPFRGGRLGKQALFGAPGRFSTPGKAAVSGGNFRGRIPVRGICRRFRRTPSNHRSPRGRNRPLAGDIDGKGLFTSLSRRACTTWAALRSCDPALGKPGKRMFFGKTCLADGRHNKRIGRKIPRGRQDITGIPERRRGAYQPSKEA